MLNHVIQYFPYLKDRVELYSCASTRAAKKKKQQSLDLYETADRSMCFYLSVCLLFIIDI